MLEVGKLDERDIRIEMSLIQPLVSFPSRESRFIFKGSNLFCRKMFNKSRLQCTHSRLISHRVAEIIIVKEIPSLPHQYETTYTNDGGRHTSEKPERTKTG